jgi:hypothetical protein
MDQPYMYIFHAQAQRFRTWTCLLVGYLAVQVFPLLARMNQHRPMHQLVILSMGWAVFLHPVPDPALTNIVSHSTFFGC